MVSDSWCCAGWRGAILLARCLLLQGPGGLPVGEVVPRLFSRGVSHIIRYAVPSPGLLWPGSRRVAADTKHDWQKAARIYPNATSRYGSWCSFSLLDSRGAATNEGIFSMKTHRSSWLAIMQTGGSVGGVHRAPSKRTVRARATRGILVLALMLGSLGAAVLALPGHGSAGQAHASVYHPAHSVVLSGYYRPWIY
jgi:hypothetical protein